MVYRLAVQWREGRRRVAGLLGLFALSACTSGPGLEDQLAVDVARRACERIQECSCAPELFDPDFGFECADISGDLADAEPSPYAFDAECGQRALGLLNGLGCSDTITLRRADICPLYFGALLEGAPCGEAILPDDVQDFGEYEQRCGRGLACIRDTCMDVRTVPYGTEGFPCELGGVCDTGLRCRESSCIRFPTPGEPCLDGDCADGARCAADPTGDDEPMCVALARVGESCMGHAECVTTNCPAGFCAEAATTGAECDDRLPCGPGLTCFDGACQLPNSCGLFFSLAPDF